MMTFLRFIAGTEIGRMGFAALVGAALTWSYMTGAHRAADRTAVLEATIATQKADLDAAAALAKRADQTTADLAKATGEAEQRMRDYEAALAKRPADPGCIADDDFLDWMRK